MRCQIGEVPEFICSCYANCFSESQQMEAFEETVTSLPDEGER